MFYIKNQGIIYFSANSYLVKSAVVVNELKMEILLN